MILAGLHASFMPTFLVSASHVNRDFSAIKEAFFRFQLNRFLYIFSK